MAPRHQQSPVLELSIDNVPLVELSFGFEQWNDERAEPPEPEPSVGVVEAAGSEGTGSDSTMTQFWQYVYDPSESATVSWFRFDESSLLARPLRHHE